MNFVAIDFETANYQPSSACAVGVVKVVNGKIVDKASYLIKPPTRDFRFTHIHGLTWQDVAKEADFGEIWAKLDPFLEGAEFLAAHNASFDRRVLEACCATFGITAPPLAFQCTVQVAQRTWGTYPTKLSNVRERLAIELNHHEALSDAMARAKIMIAATSGSTPHEISAHEEKSTETAQTVARRRRPLTRRRHDEFDNGARVRWLQSVLQAAGDRGVGKGGRAVVSPLSPRSRRLHSL